MLSLSHQIETNGSERQGTIKIKDLFIFCRTQNPSISPVSFRPLSLLVASKQAVAYCWHSSAWLFSVPSPVGTQDHIFVLIYNPYGIRRWASSSVRGGVLAVGCYEDM
jgi:hypothetical protein